MATTKLVKIQRGQFSPRFQVARAWLSAASALVSTKPVAAVNFIDDAIEELQVLRREIVGGS